MIAAPGDGWQRLSPRKLLVDPVTALKQVLVPAAIAFFGASQSGFIRWPFVLAAMVVGPLLFGALPWLTTHWRITESQFQLRTGLLNKKSSTAPLDRIRSVDLEAPLLHRLLGLQKVQIGTGVDSERITLDGMMRGDAIALRTTLLRLAPAAPAPTEDPGHAPPEGAAPQAAPTTLPPTATLLATIDWSWLRFAPFSLARLVVLAGAIGLLSQFADELPIWDEDVALSVWDWVRGFEIALVVATIAVGGLLGWLFFSVTGYAIQWWDYRLIRDAGSLHLASGLFTTRSVSVEEARIRGAELTEPLLLRGVGGAQTAVLATGVGDSDLHHVVPPCPREVAVRLGDEVLGSPEPLVAPLVAHGRIARRRAWLRHLRWSLVWPAAAGLAVWQWGWAWWAPVVVGVVAAAFAALVGESSYRHLGHALTPGHLVAGSGELARVRTALETDGIIGWVVSQSWWQRRIGLADLVATTAAGSERVLVRDIPLETGIALADAATPGLLTPFLEPVHAPLQP